MRKLVLEDGGRPLVNDDFQAIQDDLGYAASSPYHDLLPHIVSGCAIVSRGGSLYDVGSGVVWLGGELLKCFGASGITLPAEIVLDGAPTVWETRTYQNGNTKGAVQEQLVKFQPASDDSIPKIRIEASGALRYPKVVENQFRTVGAIELLAALVADDYDTDGRGKYGSAAYGWALVGSPGTAQAKGRFPVIINPDNPKFASIGAIGGTEEETLTVAQLPAHSFKLGTLATDNKGSTGNGGAYAKSDSGNSGQDRSRGTESLGQNQAHNNLPPFYGFAARQWIGF